MKYIDTHIHSSFSVDSQIPMKKMCESAINKNFLSIAFTEHLDMNPNDYGFRYFNSEAYSEAIKSSQRKYSKKIKVLKGIEFSEPHLYKKDFKTIVDSDYDIIIGSIHWIGNFFVGQLEINTSPLRKGFPETSPDETIIERYSRFGGRIVSIGSDAHNSEDIGTDFDYVFNLLNRFPELKII